MQNKELIRTFAASTILIMTCMLPIDGQNYIKTETFLDENGQRHTTDIQYYDGLGRESVLASDGVSTAGNYVYSMQTYDGNGRKDADWLPVVGSQNVTEPTVSDFQNMSQQTYQEGYGYSTMQYDALNRLVTVQSPGSAWQGHSLTKTYGTNSADEVKLYRAQLPGNSLLKLGYYQPGTLVMEQTVDEDGKITRLYKDFLDRTVLECSISGGDTLRTYYVYNNRGQLAFVLTPEYQKSGYKDLFAYEYRYDDHGRINKKILPGCDFTQYWYDQKGRIISEQNPTLREKNAFRYTLYDPLGRVAVVGTASNVNYNRDFDVTMSTSSGFLDTGYDYPQSIAITHPYIETVYYYDNYDFLNSPIFSPYQSQLSHSATNSNGLLTGQIRRTSTKEYILTAYYYDEKGQLTDKKERLYDGSRKSTTTVYSFTGKPLSETTSLTRNGTTYTEAKTFEYYEGNDKLKSLTIGYNGTSPLLTGSYDYNNLGRITTLHRGGNAGNVSYDYNMRGWTTLIDGTGFKEWLHYTDGVGTPYYTGNISTQMWKTDDEDYKRGYSFSYDGFGRMTKADYGEGDNLSTHPGYYSEWVDEYTMSSGIRKLERWGRKNNGIHGKIDNLRYYYHGMQVDSVKEDAMPLTYAGAFDFVAHTATVPGTAHYMYYTDGALKWDAHKGVSLIKYEKRGYPYRVQFSNGNTTEYVYTPDGEKLKTIYRTAVPNISVSLGQTLWMNASNTLAVDSIEYIGNFIFENGQLAKALYPGGFATFSGTTPTYHYYTQDHLGNNRAVVNEDGTLEQIVHYYPFGGIYGNVGLNDSFQRYKYNGKELDRMHGLNLYDYGARQYDPVMAMWTSVDPMAEKYYNTSPYVYCMNNPVNAIDPDGKDVLIWYKDIHGKNQLFRFSGFHGRKSIKIPNNQYVKDFIQAYLYNTKNGGGKKMIQAVTNHKYKIYVSESQENDATFYYHREDQPTIYWQSRQGLITTEGGKQSPATALEHEMDHAIDDANNHNKHVDRKKQKDYQYDDKEERRVITGSEAQTAKSNNEAIRKDHKGKKYTTISSISTIPLE